MYPGPSVSTYEQLYIQAAAAMQAATQSVAAAQSALNNAQAAADAAKLALNNADQAYATARSQGTGFSQNVTLNFYGVTSGQQIAKQVMTSLKQVSPAFTQYSVAAPAAPPATGSEIV